MKGQGDLDGRIKTLLDALSKPDNNQGYSTRDIRSDGQPLYVLLEDDKHVTSLSVETDKLLQRNDEADTNEVHLILTVRIRPYEVNFQNMHFS